MGDNPKVRRQILPEGSDQEESDRFRASVRRKTLDSGRTAKLPLCPFGSACYRKNPKHRAEYLHPDKMQEEASTTTQSHKTSQPTLANYFGKRKLDGVQSGSNAGAVQKVPKDDVNDYNIDDEELSDIEDNELLVPIKATDLKTHRKLESSKRSGGIAETNNLGRLMPDIKRILNEPDDLQKIEGSTPLDIPSSSSETDTPTKEEQGERTARQSISKRNRSVSEWKALIKQIFLVSMPDDFFEFWNLCKIISPRTPLDAFRKTLGLRLVGPFEVLAGLIDERHVGKESILTHYRFLYDPPEVQTFAVVAPDTEVELDASHLYHLGYFRDIPEEEYPVVVSNDPTKSCVISGEADNIFSAFYLLLRDKQSWVNSKDSKFYNNTTMKESVKNQALRVKAYAEARKIPFDSTEQLKKRKKKTNASTFHRFGLVVEMVDNVGYRELPKKDDYYRKLFKKITDLESDDERRRSSMLAEVQDVCRWITIANDEKDFGMGLEFGLDLFCTGHPFFHKSTAHLLNQAYQLLARQPFATIIKAHLNDRQTLLEKLSKI